MAEFDVDAHIRRIRENPFRVVVDKRAGAHVAVPINTTADVDWSKFRNSRAKLRVAVRRVLKQYKYPPEYEKAAIAAIMAQAEQTANVVSR